MLIDRRRFMIALSGLIATSGAKAQGDDLGYEWFVHEQLPDGQAWEGVWRRRGASNVFDAHWRSLANGGPVQDVVEIQGRNGDSVTIYRYGNGGTYVGELSPSGRHIRGTASWYPPGAFWSARIQ